MGLFLDRRVALAEVDAVSSFDRALALTLGFEGGTSNSAIDRGGFTHHGFTQSLYNRYRRKHGLPAQGVVFISTAEEIAIAKEYFWEPCRCDELPPPLAIAVFDMAFNSGEGDAIVALQKAVGAHVDGEIGPKTIDAAKSADSDALLRFLKARGAHLQDTIADDPPQVGNLEGWINRLLDQAWKGATP